MKRFSLLRLAAAALAASLLIVPLRASGQCMSTCGFCQQPQAPPLLAPTPSPRAGIVLPSHGTVNALVLFIDFEDEPEDINNVNWPRGSGPVGIGPAFKGLFIDQTPAQQSGRKFNITTFYRDMSFGQLTIIGYPVYKRARRTKAAYEADSTTLSNVPYWATRDVLTSLTAQDVGGWAQYDSITTNGLYSQSAGPDGAIDLVIVCYRGFFQAKYGWIGEGFASLGQSGTGGDYFIANGALKVRAGYYGSGVTWQHGINYPDCSVPFHEVGHNLLGSSERYNDDNGGLWSVMGQRAVNVSYCMNAYEREQLGWITFHEAADGLETDIPDFATTGIAYRMAYPGAEGTLEYYFENHQRLPSPYIKVAEDGIFSYDIVDRLNLPSGGVPGQKGLYIVENDAPSLRVVCADGRWNWEAAGSQPNPFNPTVTAIVFRQSTIDRVLGKTDRRVERGTYLNTPYEQFIWVWRDEATGLPTWLPTNGKQNGDGNDAWKPDGNNIFSPWSNPAARLTYNPNLTLGSAQVIRENTDGSVRVKFFTTNLDSIPPSQPQGFSATTMGGYNGATLPELSWIGNIEPAVTDGGLVEMWRQVQLYGEQAGEWELIATLPISTTSFIDESVTDARLTGGGNAVRYRMRVLDSNRRASTDLALLWW
ncbi:MAG: hypothetical protein JST22_17890, partial [Bacteroidetes bacterium]|nr:hypothetical protein [Bacteroidota bacterium]